MATISSSSLVPSGDGSHPQEKLLVEPIDRGNPGLPRADDRKRKFDDPRIPEESYLRAVQFLKDRQIPSYHVKLEGEDKILKQTETNGTKYKWLAVGCFTVGSVLIVMSAIGIAALASPSFARSLSALGGSTAHSVNVMQNHSIVFLALSGSGVGGGLTLFVQGGSFIYQSHWGLEKFKKDVNDTVKLANDARAKTEKAHYEAFDPMANRFRREIDVRQTQFTLIYQEALNLRPRLAKERDIMEAQFIVASIDSPQFAPAYENNLNRINNFITDNDRLIERFENGRAAKAKQE